MLKRLFKSMDMDKSGGVSQRRIEVLMLGDMSFHAYCFLWGSKRAFNIDNILALVPVTQKENIVIYIEGRTYDQTCRIGVFVCQHLSNYLKRVS